jgi:hypothetical protein
MPEKILRVKLIVDSGFADELKAAAVKHPDELVIESERIEADATKLGFDLGSALSIVAVAKGGWDAAMLAYKIYGWWSERKKLKGTSTIVLQTPFEKLELQSNSDITEDQIRKFLEAATIIMK